MEGWEIKSIGDLCTIKGRIGYRGYTKKDIVTKGEGAITLSPSNIKGNEFTLERCTYISWFKYEESPEIMIFEGDILFVKTGSSYGKTTIIENLKEKATINPQLVVLKDIQCINRFLYYSMVSADFKDQIETIIGGSSIPTLSQANLAKLKIVIPPNPKQKQIVALLDQAFAAIDQAKANIERNIENAKELFQSKLNAIFSQKGEGWDERTLNELIEISHGYAFKSKNFEKDFRGAKPIVLTPGNFSEDSTLYFTEKNTKRFTGEVLKSFVFEYNDLAVVMTDLSSKMKILGKPSFIKSDNILHNQRIGRVVFKSQDVSRKLLYYFFQTNNYLDEIKNSATGTMVRHTAPKRILVNKISFPKSKEKQELLVETLDKIKYSKKKIENYYQQKLSQLDQLKKSILQKAFSGELTGKSAVTSE